MFDMTDTDTDVMFDIYKNRNHMVFCLTSAVFILFADMLFYD